MNMLLCSVDIGELSSESFFGTGKSLIGVYKRMNMQQDIIKINENNSTSSNISVILFSKSMISLPKLNNESEAR